MKAVELTVDDGGVERERSDADPPSDGFLLYDLEGELFFGAGLELERCFAGILQQVEARRLDHVVLRVKRVRNPDVVCLEHLDHFMKAARRGGVVVLLAGARPDLLDALARLRLGEWLPADGAFSQRSDEDSATLAAIRFVHARIGKKPGGGLFYRV